MIEKEYKELVTKQQFEGLLREFKPTETVVQTNHYYEDGEGVLGDKKITVRVREIDDSFNLQVKMSLSEEEGHHVAREHEEELKRLPESVDGEKISKIIGYRVGECRRVGSLCTTRHKVYLDAKTELCLDNSRYLDTEDYEIEVEYTEDITAELRQRLKTHGVTFKKECKGKRSRFVERKKEMDGNV